jgi:hypothetical protein
LLASVGVLQLWHRRRMARHGDPGAGQRWPVVLGYVAVGLGSVVFVVGLAGL